VAAVCETTVAVEKGQKPRKVPKRGFKSLGLDKLITWLTAQIEDAKREFEHDAETSLAHVPQQAGLQVIASQPSQPQKDFWQEFLPAEIRKLIAGKEGLVSIIAAVLLGGGCFLGTTLFSKPTKPVATFLKKWDLDVPGTFDDGVASFGIIKNDGASGKIRVWAKVTENGVEVERQSSDLYLNQGESANYFFTMNKISRVSNRHTVDTWAEIP